MLPTLYVRFHAPVGQLEREFGRVYGAIASYLAELGQSPAGPPFAMYHNMDMRDLDVEAGFLVAQRQPGREEIQSGVLPEGDIASYVHTGSYQTVGQAYSVLAKWIEENGLAKGGAPCEFYLNDPTSTPAAELKTKVTIPVKPARGP